MADMDFTGAMWVTTEPLGHGRYTTVIHYSEDVSAALRPKEAEEYCRTFLVAVARAEHDAAVIAQLVGKVKVSPSSAVELVQALRADRPPLPAAGPLRLDPAVALDPGPRFRPFIGLYLGDEKYGQLDPAGARDHALHVMGSPMVADLDAAYRTRLVGELEASADTAAAAVEDLQHWRYIPMQGGDPR